MAVNTPGGQDLYSIAGSEFMLVEDAIAHERDKQDLIQRLEKLEYSYDNLLRKSNKIAMTAMFLEKFWTTFLAFNSLVLPALMVVILNVCSFDPVTSTEQIISTQYLMSALIGFSMIFGLPFYMYSLGDLEDVLDQMQQYGVDMANMGTQATITFHTRLEPAGDGASEGLLPAAAETEGSTFTDSMVD